RPIKAAIPGPISATGFLRWQSTSQSVPVAAVASTESLYSSSLPASIDSTLGWVTSTFPTLTFTNVLEQLDRTWTILPKQVTVTVVPVPNSSLPTGPKSIIACPCELVATMLPVRMLARVCTSFPLTLTEPPFIVSDPLHSSASTVSASGRGVSAAAKELKPNTVARTTANAKLAYTLALPFAVKLLTQFFVQLEIQPIRSSNERGVTQDKLRPRIRNKSLNVNRNVS